MSHSQLFHTKSGHTFPGVSLETALKLRRLLVDNYGLNLSQISESASYSMAMVVRFALGLSADKGYITCLVNDCLSGMIALATLRHLINAGSQADIYVLKDSGSSEFTQQLNILRKMDVNITAFGGIILSESELEKINSSLLKSHNAICGLFDFSDAAASPSLIEIMNESKTPIHTIEAPLGINCDTGSALEHPLFASSTLSLGLPFAGLYNGETFTGRHYICDISITKKLYMEAGLDLSPLFSEQPVVKIFPLIEEEPA